MFMSVSRSCFSDSSWCISCLSTYLLSSMVSMSLLTSLIVLLSSFKVSSFYFCCCWAFSSFNTSFYSSYYPTVNSILHIDRQTYLLQSPRSLHKHLFILHVSNQHLMQLIKLFFVNLSTIQKALPPVRFIINLKYIRLFHMYHEKPS